MKFEVGDMVYWYFEHIFPSLSSTYSKGIVVGIRKNPDWVDVQWPTFGQPVNYAPEQALYLRHHGNGLYLIKKRHNL